ncbi:plasmid stabilization system protein ParE [Methylopila capsulata]|uniref:Plasmid stabilization system protein ParE n=1 Tax=Methylopila capsulata TaxID=61654 RepID=A0A9W6MRR0_9HYPH|nr:type II toxin-antitoxin system RelE/ParE family toxin [Methylopila capsulata]MBM7850711.1 plasmid stabilization system protein ParE [Methylopila capsulata]GLK56005.1 hypothetical protein GCM10008170_20240 [Methylopila capsulata]
METELSARAIVDLDRLRGFLAEKNPAAASRAVQAIVDSFGLISAFPQSGARFTGSGYRRRAVRFGSAACVIDYEVAEQDAVVTILRIRHSRERR